MYLLASVAGALAAVGFFNAHYGWVGAWIGTGIWFLVDAVRAERLLRVLRRDARALPRRGPGIWGELSERIRHLVRVQDQALRQAESRLAEFLAAIQASPNGVVLLDGEGRIEWCNQTAAGQLGIDAERDLQQHLRNLVRDPAFVTYLASGLYERGVSIHAPVSASASRAQRLSIQAHRYGGDRRMLLVHDITLQEQAEAMRRDFVANVSHEIRTPLTVLSGFIETLQNLELSAPERARYLELMAQQSQRMGMLVHDLLTLSRLEGMAPAPSHQWLSVRTLIGEAEQEATGLSAWLAGQTHRFSVSIEAEAELSGASSELQSAMCNLLSNAVRYTPAGGEIVVRWRWLDDGRGEFLVSDTGPGIAPEHIPRLTERFYRVDRSRSRETGGTGLGLAIVKHVMQRHGGELRVDSRLGEGSRFALLFPASRVRAAWALSEATV